MEIKWLAEPRAVVVPGDGESDAYEVPVETGAVVDVPHETARSLIAQGVAEMANKAKKQPPGHSVAAKAAEKKEG